jgi:D-glycero-D-manno-heptose 1,7-bisphosphate phosphatase
MINNNFNKIDLVILAGGKGTRIKNLLGKYPKPMLKFNSKHFIQYIHNITSKYSFRRIIILCGYRYKIFFKKYHNKIINFNKIICLREKELLGTAGALKNLKKLNVKNFVLMNGDTIFDIDLSLLIDNLGKNKLGIVALTKNINQKSKKLNNLILKKNLIYIKKNSSLMNGGVYYFKEKIFDYIKNNFSLENELLPKLIIKKKINGKFFKNFFIDIGSKYYLKKGALKLKNQFKKPAVFLDRDGVINYDKGHVYKEKDFRFKIGVLKGLEYLIKKNYYIFIVTNQAGIAKGIYTENKFLTLHKKIKLKLQKNNIFFNDVKYSPFHPNAKVKKYKKKSLTRKPGNKMIEDIKLNWDLDLKKSFMIGDKITDKSAAEKSKIKFFYAKDNFFKLISQITNSY